MATILSQNFSYLGKHPNFERDQVQKITDLKNASSDDYCNGIIVYCIEDKKFYVYNDTKTDPTTGHFEGLVKSNSYSGTTEDRLKLKLTLSDKGVPFYDTDFKRTAYWDGTKWIDCNGYTFSVKNGTTLERPVLTTEDKYFDYFDTDINQMIYWDGTKWIDSSGKSALKTKGTTEERNMLGLSLTDEGYQFYDTDFKQTFFWNGTEWENSDGTLISRVIIY